MINIAEKLEVNLIVLLLGFCLRHKGKLNSASLCSNSSQHTCSVCTCKMVLGAKKAKKKTGQATFISDLLILLLAVSLDSYPLYTL